MKTKNTSYMKSRINSIVHDYNQYQFNFTSTLPNKHHSEPHKAVEEDGTKQTANTNGGCTFS